MTYFSSCVYLSFLLLFLFVLSFFWWPQVCIVNLLCPQDVRSPPSQAPLFFSEVRSRRMVERSVLSLADIGLARADYEDCRVLVFARARPSLAGPRISTMCLREGMAQSSYLTISEKFPFPYPPYKKYIKKCSDELRP